MTIRREGQRPEPRPFGTPCLRESTCGPQPPAMAKAGFATAARDNYVPEIRMGTPRRDLDIPSTMLGLRPTGQGDRDRCLAPSADIPAEATERRTLSAGPEGRGEETRHTIVMKHHRR